MAGGASDEARKAIEERGTYRRDARWSNEFDDAKYPTVPERAHNEAPSNDHVG
jgi:hypothetical protein